MNPQLSKRLHLVALLLAACGGSDVTECFDDRTCGLNMRCNRPSDGQKGTCGPCDAEETPYDGQDNDCNSRSRDVDLDSDGDNWIGSPIRPGTDCDDQDPTTSPAADELCGDSKDNDCDGTVDEIDCGDMLAPTVTIARPMENDTIAGTFMLEVEARDDVGLRRVEVLADGVVVETVPLNNLLAYNNIFAIDSATQLSDGTVTLSVIAHDVKDRSGSAQVVVSVDNRTPPSVSFSHPMMGRAYGQMMTIEATIRDPSGVANVEMQLDGTSRLTATTPPFRFTIDTTTMPEGPHTLRVIAEDVPGNVGTTDVTFVVDNTPPVVGIRAPTRGQQLMGGVAVDVEATDNLSTTTSIYFAGLRGGSPLQGTLNTALLPNGAVTLTATASDGAILNGNLSSGNIGSATVDVVVQNVGGGPVVTLQPGSPQPNDEVSGRVLIQANPVAGSGRSIREVRFKVNDATHSRDGTFPFEGLVDFSFFTGSVTLTVEAVDNAGATGAAVVQLTAVPPLPARAPDSFRSANIDLNGYAVYDITNDGVLDFVTTGTHLRVLEGQITGGRWNIADTYEIQLLTADVRFATIFPGGGTSMILFGGDRITVANPIILDTGLQGAATFTPQRSGNSSIDLGDIDGDGDLDILLGGGNTSGSFLLWDQGTGGYVAGPVLPDGWTVAKVFLRDVDADGDLDAMVARAVGAFSVSMYLNDGLGNFGAAIEVPSAGAPDRIDLGDINGDNFPDLVVGHSQLASVELKLGSSANPGSFTQMGTFTSLLPSVSQVLLQDVDGDNDRDILVFGAGVSGVDVWRNDGAGSFERAGAYALGVNPVNARFVDMTGDGAQELVLVDTHDDLTIARVRPSGEIYAPRVIPYGERIQSMALGDLVPGGNPEIVIAGIMNTMRVHSLDLTDVSLTEIAADTTSPTDANSSVVVAQLDGAGGLDIAKGSSPALYLNQGYDAGMMRLQVTETILPTGMGSVHAAVDVGDVDHDGSMDLVTLRTHPSNPSAAGFSVYQGVFGAALDIQAGFNSNSQLIVGDFDSDGAGLLEVGLFSPTASTLTVSTFSGGTWSSLGIGMPTSMNQAALGRIDDDARNDVVVGTQTAVHIFAGDPATVFATPTIVTVPGGIVVPKILDISGDGRADIVGVSNSGRLSMLVRRAGAGYFYPRPISVPVDSRTLLTADFDGDGRTDFLTGSVAGNSVLCLVTFEPF